MPMNTELNFSFVSLRGTKRFGLSAGWGIEPGARGREIKERASSASCGFCPTRDARHFVAFTGETRDRGQGPCRGRIRRRGAFQDAGVAAADADRHREPRKGRLVAREYRSWAGVEHLRVKTAVNGGRATYRARTTKEGCWGYATSPGSFRERRRGRRRRGGAGFVVGARRPEVGERRPWR
jgi:hypothetical protein